MKLSRLDTIPNTPDEMVAMLLEAGRARAYVEISGAARRQRLTENDISIIERNILADCVVTPEIAQEFKTFEAEPAFAEAHALLKQYFAIAKAARIKDVQQQ